MKIKCFQSQYLVIFYILLLFFTYVGLGEEFIAVVAAGVFVLKVPKTLKVGYKSRMICFVAYYSLVTFFGFLIGITGIKDLLQFIIQYYCMPLIIWFCIPVNKRDRERSIKNFRDFILVSAIYGTLEFLLRNNPIRGIVMIEAGYWMDAMEKAKVYQPSSFYLHYNFYGCILVIGWIILLHYPLKHKSVDVAAKLLVLLQLFLSQSRICWVCFAVTTLLYAWKKCLGSVKLFQRIMIVCAGGILIFFMIPGMAMRTISAIQTRFAPVFQYGFDYGSVGQRIGTFLNWFSYAMKNPLKGMFGRGFGSIDLYLEDYSYFPGYVTSDCQWTTYLAEIGLIGTLILIYLLIRYMRSHRYGRYHEFSKMLIFALLIESITFEVMGTNFMLVLVLWGLFISIRLLQTNAEDGMEGNYVREADYEAGYSEFI